MAKQQAHDRYETAKQWDIAREAQVNAARRIIEDDLDGILFGVKNSVTRQYVNVRAGDSNRARLATGWPPGEILYCLQTEKTPKPKKELTEEKKIELRERLKRAREMRRPKAEGRGAEDETMATNKKKAKTVQKAGGRNGELFGFSLSAVMRKLGKDGYDFAQTKAAMRALKVEKMPSDGSIHSSLGAGKKGDGEPAALTTEQYAKIKAVLPAKEEGTKAPAKREKKGAKKVAANKKELPFSKEKQLRKGKKQRSASSVVVHAAESKTAKEHGNKLQIAAKAIDGHRPALNLK